MSSSKDSFDTIGIVVDWLAACREGQLSSLSIFTATVRS
jgi:hypothetical protein